MRYDNVGFSLKLRGIIKRRSLGELHKLYESNWKKLALKIRTGLPTDFYVKRENLLDNADLLIRKRLGDEYLKFSRVKWNRGLKTKDRHIKSTNRERTILDFIAIKPLTNSYSYDRLNNIDMYD